MQHSKENLFELCLNSYISKKLLKLNTVTPSVLLQKNAINQKSEKYISN